MARTNLKRLFANDKLKAGHLLFEFSTPGIGQILKIAELDFVFVDMEHSGFGISELKRLITSLRAADLPALVRPPSKNYQHIARVLDVGADGLILPMVASAEEAREIIQHMCYPPRGHRGIALGIAHDGYAPQTPAAALAAANRRIAMTALIETVEGLENVDTIAAVPGVDCIWIGHFDLSAALGIPGQFDHPDFTKAEQRIRRAARRHGKALGFLVVTAEQGITCFRKGYDVICYQTDVLAYQQTLSDGIGRLRKGCKGSKGRGKS
ncbi:MAG: aldolase/citrate lyase family protein [Arenicellales bacterium]|jgi:2-dehydro-3-deoxyglucarate aldolase/4-hydroxy-2-oxoheptanedioate aldolase